MRWPLTAGDLREMKDYAFRISQVHDSKFEGPRTASESVNLVEAHRCKIVPTEENFTVRPSCLDCGESGRKIGPVFQGLELRLGEGIVIRHVWSALGLSDAEIGEEERDRFRRHR